MREQKYINQGAKEASGISSDIIKYLYTKWFEVMNKTNLTLSRGSRKKKRHWMVQDDKFKNVCSGSFKRCMDFMIKQYIKISSK